MAEPGPFLDFLRDPRVAVHATAAAPAWLWNPDATRMLWANAAGAAIFGAPGPAALSARAFDATHPVAAQIARLTPMLTVDAPPRLERLRGLANFGRALTCACSRIALAGETAAVLIVAVEGAGPALQLAERTRRLLADRDGEAAAFSPDGKLLSATPAALDRLAGATTLDALGAGQLAKEALSGGRADGDARAGAVEIVRLGNGASTVLLLTFAEAQPAPAASEDRSPEPAAAVPQAAAPRERHHPLRFVWRTDANEHFSLESDEFAALIGPASASMLGGPWQELAASLTLDPAGEFARALSSRNTWSNIVLSWPVEGSDERLIAEMSGLPIFNRERQFTGYRGFGICRDVARIADLLQARATANLTPVEEARASSDTGQAAAAGPPPLSPVEQRAFRELARQLTERLGNAEARSRHPAPIESLSEATDAAAPPPDEPLPDTPRAILDSLPLAILVYRSDTIVYANPAFLAWTGHDSLAALAAAGGLGHLRIEPAADAVNSFLISADRDDPTPVEARLTDVAWEGERARMLTLSGANAGNRAAEAAPETPDLALHRAEAATRELRSILDTATDGVVVIDQDARIVSCNRSAEALFGWESGELAGRPFADLFAPESRRAAADYLDGLQRAGVASLLNDGREVIGVVRPSGLIPLFMTMGRVSDSTQKFCAVFRDITQWKKAEEELINARRLAEKASSAKSEFLAKISHEIRTPLNAVIGFSEVMMSERFGPIGNERYREYLKDIHTSGAHLVSLINDLLDLSKIEAGKVDLTFARVNLNELTQQCVAIMQPQANRERIIIRTSIAPALPNIVADARSVRQIVLNLLSNSIKFTGPGGQVIVSTALSDAGEAVLRVRDTGVGMSEKDIATALEPFRQLATSARWGSGGTGLGLPLTKALAEANRASFHITSTPNAGTLVEIAFPATRVLAE